MLTEAEKKWLGNREFANAVDYGAYSCPSCWWLNKELEECILRRCLRFDPDWQDAAEFEARIQKKQLHLWAGGKAKCPYKHCCAVFVVKKHWTEADKLNVCGWCIQRHTRLAVEAEMEQEK